MVTLLIVIRLKGQRKSQDIEIRVISGLRNEVQDVQLKSGPYFNMSNLCTKIYNMLY